MTARLGLLRCSDLSFGSLTDITAPQQQRPLRLNQQTCAGDPRTSGAPAYDARVGPRTCINAADMSKSYNLCSMKLRPFRLTLGSTSTIDVSRADAL